MTGLGQVEPNPVRKGPFGKRILSEAVAEEVVGDDGFEPPTLSV